MKENQQRIIENSKYHEQFDDCELINSIYNLKETKKRNSLFRERAMRTNSLTPAKLKSMRGSVIGSLNLVEPAPELDMDHVYVGFFDFLWAYTFIGPFSYLLWKRGESQSSLITIPGCYIKLTCTRTHLQEP